MTLENFIELAFVIVAAILVAIKREGMKRYIPVALFAFMWAVVWCEIAEFYQLWDYPSRLITFIDVSATGIFVLAPVAAMFWVRYAPSSFKMLVLWNLLFSGAVAASEYLVERYTNLLKYYNGYEWYYSFLLWFVSLFVWYGFHHWFYKNLKVE